MRWGRAVVCCADKAAETPWTLKSALQELQDAGALTLPPPPPAPCQHRASRRSTPDEHPLTTTPSAAPRVPMLQIGAAAASAAEDGSPKGSPRGAAAGAACGGGALPALLQHSLHDAGAAFAPKQPLAAQPMLWNLVGCQHPDGDAAPLLAARVPPSPCSHRHGCLPTLLLLACPAVAQIYLAQAAAPPLRPGMPSTAPAPPEPIPGMSAVECALLSEAATGPAWHLGPTDVSLVARQCEVAAAGVGYASPVALQLDVQSALSVYFVAKRAFLHVRDEAEASDESDARHELSLELACCKVTIFDLPAVLYVLGASAAALWALLDTASAAAGGCGDATEGGRDARRGSMRRGRKPRLSLSSGLFDSGMHELPAWLQEEPPDEIPTLMLLPVDPAGARCCSLARPDSAPGRLPLLLPGARGICWNGWRGRGWALVAHGVDSGGTGPSVSTPLWPVPRLGFAQVHQSLFECAQGRSYHILPQAERASETPSRLPSARSSRNVQPPPA
jgi:hypothetical protein